MSSATCSGGSAGSGQCVDGYHPRQCGGLVQGGELSYGEGTKGRRASDPATPPDAEPRPRSRTPSRSAVVTNTSRSAVGLARSQPRRPEPRLPAERQSSEQMSVCTFLPGLRVHRPERKCPVLVMKPEAQTGPSTSRPLLRHHQPMAQDPDGRIRNRQLFRYQVRPSGLSLERLGHSAEALKTLVLIRLLEDL
jgi:hypothetical protein